MRKLPGQRKRWRWPRDEAIEMFMEALGGDRLLPDVTRLSPTHCSVLDGEIIIATANKSIRHAASTFRTLNRKEQWNLPDTFQHAIIEGEKDGKRGMYEAEYIQDNFLAEGAFAGVNPEARGVLYLMVETGIRPSEACGLTEDDIQLDCLVPHIIVGDARRELKSDNAQRMIPLVGVSLMAMQANPNGFPRYWDKAGSLSALLNKALQARGLRPLKKQSLYSLRHSFESRLTVAGVDDPVRAELMGHTYYRANGGSLEFKRDCIRRAALRPPTSV
jgi:integrase